MKFSLVLAMTVGLAAGVARAEEEKKLEPKNAKEQADYEEYGPWKVKVPSELRGIKFKLRIGADEISLNTEEITIKGSDFRERVELIDEAGRIMSSTTIYVDPYIFEYVETRTWRVGIHLGSTSINGNGFRALLQDSHLTESNFDFEWQPGPIGVRLTAAGLESRHEHDFDIVSKYNGSQTRLAATFEWVPMPNSNAFFRKLHLLSYVGLMAAYDQILISDGTVDIEDESSSTGAFLGNDFMFPIWRFWINLRVYASYHTIKFEDLDFEQKSVQRGFLIGGSYAF